MAQSVGASAASGWLKEDSRRILHAVYRVGDLKKSVDFYTKSLGLKELRHRDVPDEKYTNSFLGFGDEKTHTALELTYNYGREEYDLGTGFGHFALASPDISEVVGRVKEQGFGTVSRDVGPVKGGKTQTNIAFVDDPTGYKWELIERKDQPIPEPLAQIMLRVGNLERSIAWYTDVLGCQLLRTSQNEEYKYTLAFLAYGPEKENTVFELTYNWDKDSYTLGEGYAQVAISTKDVYKTAEQIKAAGGKITKEPGPVSNGTKVVATTDPDGWKVVFVDNEDFLKELE